MMSINSMVNLNSVKSFLKVSYTFFSKFLQSFFQNSNFVCKKTCLTDYRFDIFLTLCHNKVLQESTKRSDKFEEQHKFF